MLKILDYRCDDCCTITEHFVTKDEPRECQHCGGVSRSFISGTSFRLEGVSGDFPTAYQKWDKGRAQQKDYEATQGKTPFGEVDY